MRQGIEAWKSPVFKFQLLISCSRRIPAAALKKTAELQLFFSFFLANLTGWPWRSVQLYTMTAWWVIYTFCVNDTCKYISHVYVSFYLFQIRKKCMVWLRHDSYTTDLLVPIQIRETDMYANVACTVDTNSVHTYTANRKSATANFKHLTFVFFRARSIQPGTKKRMSSYQNIHYLIRSLEAPGTGVPINNAQWIDIVAVLSFACKP